VDWLCGPVFSKPEEDGEVDEDETDWVLPVEEFFKFAIGKSGLTRRDVCSAFS